MSATKTTYTLSFSPPAEGWPSFYSYVPDWMQGMNQYFYSFSGGNLWRHNTNETRNNYYGVQYNSTVQSVFNQEPVTNKLFKTISLEGDDAWGATAAITIVPNRAERDAAWGATATITIVPNRAERRRLLQLLQLFQIMQNEMTRATTEFLA